MASIRILKKDINSIVLDAINECDAFMDIHPDAPIDRPIELMEKTMDLQNDTLDAIISVDKSLTKKETHLHFNEIKKNFILEINNVFEEIEKLYASINTPVEAK